MLPTIYSVYISVVAVSLKKKNIKLTTHTIATITYLYNIKL